MIDNFKTIPFPISLSIKQLSIKTMAISTAERRFLREWEMQRQGSRVGYYALYMAMWTIICMLSLFFVMNYFDLIIKKSSTVTFFFMLIVSVIFAAIFTHYVWSRNEKRFKALINREINQDVNLN